MPIALPLTPALPRPRSLVDLEIARLTQAMARQDEAAYTEFYQAYFKRLLGYLLLLTQGDEDRAKEALQLTFLRVVRYIRKFDNEPAFWSWLTVLARSSLIDEARKQKRYFAFLERWAAGDRTSRDLDGSPSADPASDWIELLESQLPALSPDDQSLIRSKYMEGKSVREVATESNSTEKAVESRLVSARKKLRMLVRRRLARGEVQ